MTSTTTEYRVRSGDTLYTIARRYNVTVDALSRQNGVSDVNRIWVGQVLKIPQEYKASSSPAPKLVTHRVFAGETLTELARRYNVTVEALAQANSIQDPNRILIGQTLKIPEQSQLSPQVLNQGDASAKGIRTKTKTDSPEDSGTQASRPKTQSTQVIQTPPYDPGKEIKSFGRVRNDDGVNLHEMPHLAGAVLKRLKFNRRVFVSHELPGDWYFVTLDDGNFGYVYSKYVSIHPPDPEAVLHKIKHGEGALQIVKQHYAVKPNEGLLGIAEQIATLSPISWGEDWGQDERFYANVLVEANRSKNLSGIYKPGPDADWDETRTRENYLIWIPSPDFAMSMRGQVGSGSISNEVWQAAKHAAEALGDFILGHVAFSAGLIHGILESIWDLLTGLVDLVELVWKILKSIITGEFLSDLKALWEFVEKLDFKALVNVGLQAFRSRWHDKNFLKRWHFRGWVVGYAIAEIVMAIITGSAALVKWAGKAGKFGKLIAKFPKIVKLAERVTAATKGIKAVAKQKILKAVIEACEKLPVKKLTSKSLPTVEKAERLTKQLKVLKKSQAAVASAEAQYEAAMKKLRTALRVARSTAYSGVDPKILAAMANLGYAAAKRGIKRFELFWQELKATAEFKQLEKLGQKELDELALEFKKGVDQEAVDAATLERFQAQQAKKPTATTPSARKALRRAIAGVTSEFELKFKGGSKGLLANIDEHGVVELMVEAGKDSPLRGFEMFGEMMEHFGSKAKAIRGSWTYGDNLGEVNRLTAAGMPLEEAILKTKTGQWAAAWGFTSARPEKVVGKPGAYKVLHILFEEGM